MLLPIGLIIGVFARPAGALADRLGVRGFLVAGLVPAWRCPPRGSASPPAADRGVVAAAGAAAVGMALVVVLLTTTVMNAAPDALAGAASGVNNAASRLAGLFAVALVGAMVALVFGMAADVPGARFGVIPAAGDPSPQSLPPRSAARGAPAGRRGGAGRARGGGRPADARRRRRREADFSAGLLTAGPGLPIFVMLMLLTSKGGA